MPADYRIGIVPASDTGAVEMAMWSLLGARRVDRLGMLRRRLGQRHRQAIEAQGRHLLHAGYGELPDLAKADPASDMVFTWNGTTSGVRVPNGDWIAPTAKA